MEKIKYPDIDKQKAAHKIFIDELAKLRETIRSRRKAFSNHKCKPWS